MERPNCSSTSTHSSFDQPCPPCSRACSPPWSSAAIASERIRSSTSAGRSPPASSACSSSGISTSSTNRRARDCSSACPAVSSVTSSATLMPASPPPPTGAWPLRCRHARAELLPALVVQDPLGGVVAAGRHHAAAGMRPGAAEVQPLHGRRVLRERRCRAHERHLVEPLLALEDVAAEQAEDPLEVGRGEHLVVHDGVAHVRRDRRELVEAGLRVGLARALGPALLVVRAVLREHRHHRRAVVRQRRVDARRHLDLEVGRLRRLAAHGVLPGALEVVDRGAEGDAGAQQHVAVLVGDALVARWLRQDPVDLHRPAARLVALQVPDDLVGEVLGAGELEHGRLRVRPRHDDRRPQLLPGLQCHPERAPVAHVDRAHGGAGAHDRAERLGAARDRHRDRAHAALHVPPQPRDAVDLAQRVVEQVVRGARRARPRPHPDHPGRRGRALEEVVLEPVVEQVAHRHRHHAVEVVHVALAQPGGAARLAQEPEQVARALGAERRRRAQHQRAQEAGHPLEQVLEGRDTPRRPSSRSAPASRPSPAGRCGRTSRARRRRSRRTPGRADGPRSRSP